MAIIQVRGTQYNMLVRFHQEHGSTVKIVPGRFCPAWHETRDLDVDEGFANVAMVGAGSVCRANSKSPWPNRDGQTLCRVNKPWD
jgi:hypothetical protein